MFEEFVVPFAPSDFMATPSLEAMAGGLLDTPEDGGETREGPLPPDETPSEDAIEEPVETEGADTDGALSEDEDPLPDEAPPETGADPADEDSPPPPETEGADALPPPESPDEGDSATICADATDERSMAMIDNSMKFFIPPTPLLTFFYLFYHINLI